MYKTMYIYIYNYTYIPIHVSIEVYTNKGHEHMIQLHTNKEHEAHHPSQQPPDAAIDKCAGWFAAAATIRM